MESNVSNVWVDHCTLEQYGGESDGYDSLFDLKTNTKYVTLSYSILRNSGRGGFVGSSDSDDQNNYVTFHHNYYQNIDSRTPLLRHATAHAYNNYYDGINKSGMNPRIVGRIKAQINYFEDAKPPSVPFIPMIWGIGVLAVISGGQVLLGAATPVEHILLAQALLLQRPLVFRILSRLTMPAVFCKLCCKRRAQIMA
jgi:Pectate lyase